VTLGEIIKSKPYDEVSSPLALALARTSAECRWFADLARMPHLLIAGTTGSGSRWAINAMVSPRVQGQPRARGMIMIDPKMLELSVYEGIPHTVVAVVTDMKQAANALRWCVAEMERRYQLMSMLGVRNIGGFNRKVKDAADRADPSKDPIRMAKIAQAFPASSRRRRGPDFAAVHRRHHRRVGGILMMIVGKKVEN